MYRKMGREGEEEQRKGGMEEERLREREIFKELTHMIKGASKSEICRTALQARDPEKI